MNRLLGSFLILVHVTLDVVTGSLVSQPDRVIISKLGETVTVKCITPKDTTNYFFWYQQRLGQMLRIICMAQANTDPQFYNEFKASHFSVEKAEGAFHLKIRNSTWSDQAMYYCASRTTFGHINFEDGTFVRIEGKFPDETQPTSMTVLIQSPTPDSVYPSDCTEVSETRTEELSLIWFGPATPDSRPGLVYTYTNSSNVCETRSMLKCLHELGTNNDSNTATRYCAVRTCGQVLFGNGTTGQTESSVDYIVLILGGTLCLCVILDIFLIYSFYKKNTCLNCQEQPLRPVQANAGREASDQEEDDCLNYTALHFSQRTTPGSRQRRDTPQHSVYSDVRGSEW